jgi:hypothetical protein
MGRLDFGCDLTSQQGGESKLRDRISACPGSLAVWLAPDLPDLSMQAIACARIENLLDRVLPLTRTS